MKQHLFFLFVCLLASNSSLYAQSEGKPVRMEVIEWMGETIGNGEMDSVYIYGAKMTGRDARKATKKRENYDKMRWNVHKVYPYAVGVAELLREVEKETRTMPNDASKKTYLEKRQKEIFSLYQDDVEGMTSAQGKVLIKLIHRQTGNTLYSLIKDTKNGTTAFFWNGVGSLFGLSLKTEFDPGDDDLIGQFAQELDGGCFNIVYQQVSYKLKN